MSERPKVYSAQCTRFTCNTPHEEVVIEEALARGPHLRAELLTCMAPEAFVSKGHGLLWRAVGLLARLELEYQEGLLYSLALVFEPQPDQEQILLLERRLRMLPGPERLGRALEGMKRKVLCAWCNPPKV